jgi:hypothetical protein
MQRPSTPNPNQLDHDQYIQGLREILTEVERKCTRYELALYAIAKDGNDGARVVADKALDIFRTRPNELINKSPTVKVRIAVVVDLDGEWAAYGNKHANDDGALAVASDCAHELNIAYFVECEVPIPTIQTLEGKVV